MKEARVNKDVKQQKLVQANEDAKKSFFQSRDKKAAPDFTGQAAEDMSEKQALYEQSLAELPLPSYIEPMFNGVFLTARRNKLQTESGLYLPTSSFNDDGTTDIEQDFADVQRVVSVGPQVQQLKTGMEVKLKVENFRVRLDEKMADKVNRSSIIRIPVQDINGKEYIHVTERDIIYITDNGNRDLKDLP